MTLVTASIEIDAPRERVYDFMLDPARLDEWVTIHRRVNSRDAGEPREGFEMNQTLCLRGANFQVHWTLTEAERPDRATWEGRGPAHSYARTSTRSTTTAAPRGSSTRTSSRRPAASSAPPRAGWRSAACRSARRGAPSSGSRRCWRTARVRA